jgi:hypothetical protein
MTAASCQHMLHINCQQGAFQGVQKGGNHWGLGQDGNVKSPFCSTGPSKTISLDPLRRTWLATDLQQMPM